LYRDEFRHGRPLLGDHNFLAALDPIEQCRKIVLCFGGLDFGHWFHVAKDE